MTVTAASIAEPAPSTAPAEVTVSSSASPRVRVLDGFFVERSADPRAEVKAEDKEEEEGPPLFMRYALAPPSWAAFEARLAREAGAARVKVLYLVRHAEGTHNAKDREVGTPRWEAEFARTEAFLDADLTPFGVDDARRKGRPAVRRELARGMPRLERVVVSPMSRAIQTAQNFFAPDQLPEAPFAAFELCRETLGVHTCDKRRPLSELRRKFPDVDFAFRGAAMRDEQDVMWEADHRETSAEIQARALLFLAQLYREVPERHVAVVAHSGFIEAVCAVTLGQTIHAANCECIPMVLEVAADEV